MSDSASSTLPCEARIALAPLGPGRWRAHHAEPNQNNRSYGGHLLGLAMQAALQHAPDGRHPTMMQFLFEQGALTDRPVDLAVAPLQQGKRFSSWQVRGTQAERSVLSAQISFAPPLDGPQDELPSPVPSFEHPDDLPPYAELPAAFHDAVDLLGGFGRGCEPAIEHRIPRALDQLHGPGAGRHFRFWLRVPQPLPDDERLHFAALAYLSDWWLNFCMWIPQLQRAEARRIYVASLNHAMWFHRTPRADAWIHVDTECLQTGRGRGLALGRFHDLQGRHLATATQECLTTYHG